MPLIGRLMQVATDTLTEAKLIKAERGPAETKRLVSKIVKLATKPDKKDLCSLSNYEVFLAFMNLINDRKFSVSETESYCKEVQRVVNSWTLEKDGERLRIMYENTNNDGSLTHLQYTKTMEELGLTPVFISYEMKLIYDCLYHFLKLKKDILQGTIALKKMPLAQKMIWTKNIYTNNKFFNYIDVAQQILKRDEEEHAYRQKVSGERIKVTKELIKMVDDGKIEELLKIPKEWHEFLDPLVLEVLYDIISQNLLREKLAVDNEEKTITDKINASPLTTYLYKKGLNPYSLDTLSSLEAIPTIISRIEFFEYIGIPVNNALTTYYDLITSITDEELSRITPLAYSKIISPLTLRTKLRYICSKTNEINANYEILKGIIDFNSIFYDDAIILKDIKELKYMLSILKEYNLTKSNYMFLLCNFNYLHIYDLILENEIPEELFISICKTQNPLNTIKRIIIYKNIGENYITSGNFLKKDVTSQSKFICDDEDLDSYVPNIVVESGLNLLNGSSITTIVGNELVKELDSLYRVGDKYIIGQTIISRAKFLRNFESANGNINYLIISLVSSSILNEYEYNSLTKELKKITLKK